MRVVADKTLISPIFVCGHPKSGTTLLLSLLDSHPELATMPIELKYFNLAHHKTNPNKKLFNKAVFCNQEQSPEFSLQTFKEQLTSTWESSKSFKDLFQNILVYWLENISERAHEKRLVEKTPFNEFDYEYLNEWYGSNAAYIYIVRDPRDVFSTYSLKHPDLGVECFCANWMLSNKIARFANSENKRFFILKYEDLVHHPYKTMEQITQFLEIQFSETLLQPTIAGQAWGGNSRYGYKFESISDKSIGKYSNILKCDDLSFIENSLSRYMRELKYCNTKYSSNPTETEKQVDHLFHYWRVDYKICQTIEMLSFKTLMAKHSNLYLWGAGSLGQILLPCLRQLNIQENIKCFIDSDASKTNSIVEKIPVIHPSALDPEKQLCIVITSIHEKEILHNMLHKWKLNAQVIKASSILDDLKNKKLSQDTDIPVFAIT